MSTTDPKKQLLQGLDKTTPIKARITFEFTKEKVVMEQTLSPLEILEYVEDVEERGLVFGKARFERYYPAQSLIGVVVEWS